MSDEEMMFCDGGVVIWYEMPEHGERPEPQLEFRGHDTGCSCCVSGVSTTDPDKIVAYLKFHQQQYQEKASWFTMALSMIYEVGQAEVATMLANASQINQILARAVSTARREEQLMTDAQTEVRGAMVMYGQLDTQSKVVVEFFAGNILLGIARSMGQLVEWGYDLDSADLSGLPLVEES